MGLIKSIIELSVAPILVIPLAFIKIIEHYKMLDEMNTNHNQ